MIYHETKHGILYHADCMDWLERADIKRDSFDLTLTDPPYGVEGGHGGQLKDYKKADYSGVWQDTPEYIKDVCAPACTASRFEISTKDF
jgi:DNA modification methylase